MSKELEKMRKELKKKIGFLVLAAVLVVLGVFSYYGRDWIKYRIESHAFRNVINQCSIEVGERNERFTEKEIAELIEECVKTRNKNTKFNFRAN